MHDRAYVPLLAGRHPQLDRLLGAWRLLHLQGTRSDHDDPDLLLRALGAGQVGGTLAQNLASEANDITIVDANENKLRDLRDRLDIGVVDRVEVDVIRIESPETPFTSPLNPVSPTSSHGRIFVAHWVTKLGRDDHMFSTGAKRSTEKLLGDAIARE